jgi:hypothetical protein
MHKNFPCGAKIIKLGNTQKFFVLIPPDPPPPHHARSRFSDPPPLPIYMFLSEK